MRVPILGRGQLSGVAAKREMNRIFGRGGDLNSRTTNGKMDQRRKALKNEVDQESNGQTLEINQ
jgi:hypothetical protein